MNDRDHRTVHLSRSMATVAISGLLPKPPIGAGADESHHSASTEIPSSAARSSRAWSLFEGETSFLEPGGGELDLPLVEKRAPHIVPHHF